MSTQDHASVAPNASVVNAPAANASAANYLSAPNYASAPIPGLRLSRQVGDPPPGCTLIGGIGLPWLRDLDFGTAWLDRAAALGGWPDNVRFEDLSYAAHRVMHRLEELQPGRVVLVGCMPRGDVPAGTVRRYAVADLGPLDLADVHERLTEAVGGIIDMDHTVAVCRWAKAFPPDTTVIEVEPEDREFGLGFSPAVELAVDQVMALVRRELGGGVG